MLNNAWIALIITFALALIWLRVNDFIAHRGWVSSPVSRKIIHMGTGPIFVLCWLLFPEVQYARYLAALVPLGITAQFLLVGLGAIKDQASVDAMSRNGDPREILKGPLYYGLVFVVLALLYWRDSMVGIVALMLLCGGDGLADIVGKKMGKMRIPWSKEKSIQGSIAMFVGGWTMTLGVLFVYIRSGIFDVAFGSLLAPVTLIALAGTLMESLPFKDIDNITVPTLAVVLGNFLLL